MIIVFLDQLGCYAAVLAAFYRAGIVGESPTIREICSLPKFAGHQDLSTGNLYYIGEDRTGARLYTLGAGKEGRLVTVAVGDLLKTQKVAETVYLVDVSGYNTFLIRLSWQASRIGIARRAAVYLAALRLKKIMRRLVEDVIKELNQPIKPV